LTKDKSRKRSPRSRVTTGSQLLPTTDGRSLWGRLMSDCTYAVTEHAGGPEQAGEPKRLLARRIGTLEAELCFLEDGFARVRAEGGAPTPQDLDLYSRLSNTQRRHLEAIGIDRSVIDITPASAKELLIRKGDVSDV
jgi:hypothetical protein